MFFQWRAGPTLQLPSLDMVTLAKTGNTYAFTYTATGNGGTQETAQGSGRLYYTAQALNGKVLDTAYTGFVDLNGRPVGSVSLTDDHTGAFVTAFSSAGGSPSVDLALGVTSADLYTTWTIAGTTSVAILNNVLNVRHAPAPLPILGAFAALGWSRKLRRRIRGTDEPAPTDTALAA